MKRILLIAVLGVFCATTALALDPPDVISMMSRGVSRVTLVEVVSSQKLSRPATAHEVAVMRNMGTPEYFIEFLFSSAAHPGYRSYPIPAVQPIQPVIVAPAPTVVYVPAPPPPPPAPRYHQPAPAKSYPIFEFLGRLLDDKHDNRHDDRRPPQRDDRHDRRDDRRGHDDPRHRDSGGRR